ncbi:MAG TPA: sulfatase [Prosthecobacter sp.]|nr:sulfatase [Prosthecobacter sp.]HRK15527.1 sulfatase [Prosthecobacter sp.]
MKTLITATLLALACSLPAAGKPNFILINIDDQGYADIGPYGSDNATPNLDRMAREGMKLTSHYAAPVCSPSRAMMMTGCYPKRVLPTPHVLFPAGAIGLNPDETTLAEVLKSRGYATACIGKWHLGDQPEFLPTAQGFDTYYGIPYSNDMGTAAEGSKSNPGQPMPDAKAAAKKKAQPASDEAGIRGNAQPPLPLVENLDAIERIKQDGQHSITRRYTEKALDFIRQSKDGPFFLYLPHTAVHFPLYPDKQHMGKSPNGLVGDWAQELDSSTGQILDLLRELGLAENTLVIYTSDNGGALNHSSKNTPLRGGKGQTYEGGIRVATLAWWPGKIHAGSSTDAITAHFDFLPTFAALAGASLPERKLDGKDISPLLLGKLGAKSRDTFYYYRGHKLEAVRFGMWKLHLDKGELYSLREDIGESNDIAASHPDQVAQLRELAQKMAADLGLDGPDAPGVRPLGRVADPLPFIAHDGKVRPGADGKYKHLD